MSVVYVTEYEPSSAKLTLGEDPFYKKSVKSERIRIRAVAAPSPIGILLILGLFYLLVRK